MSNKKSIRNQFRLSVFKRDRFCCKCCGVKGKDRQGGEDHLKFHKTEPLADLDSHHITNRDDMPNGGYVKENGISVCDKCHLKAEEWLQNGTGAPGFAPNDLYAKIDSSVEKAKIASQRLI